MTSDFLISMALIASFAGGGYLWLRHQAREFDRKYDKR